MPMVAHPPRRIRVSPLCPLVPCDFLDGPPSSIQNLRRIERPLHCVQEVEPVAQASPHVGAVLYIGLCPQKDHMSDAVWSAAKPFDRSDLNRRRSIDANEAGPDARSAYERDAARAQPADLFDDGEQRGKGGGQPTHSNDRAFGPTRFDVAPPDIRFSAARLDLDLPIGEQGSDAFDLSPDGLGGPGKSH